MRGRQLLIVTTCLGLPGGLLARQAPDERPRVRFETTMGDFTVELRPDRAPKTVANFLHLVETGYYNDIVFHRVVKNKVIQAGVLDADGRIHGGDIEPILNEADNRLHNGRGTIAMARGAQPQSATTEFFINVSDNWAYDFKSYTRDQYGYAVFGEVVEGMDVVERIGKLETRRLSRFREFPVTMVLIYAAYVVEDIP